MMLKNYRLLDRSVIAGPLAALDKAAHVPFMCLYSVSDLVLFLAVNLQYPMWQLEASSELPPECPGLLIERAADQTDEALLQHSPIDRHFALEPGTPWDKLAKNHLLIVDIQSVRGIPLARLNSKEARCDSRV